MAPVKLSVAQMVTTQTKSGDCEIQEEGPLADLRPLESQGSRERETQWQWNCLLAEIWC